MKILKFTSHGILSRLFFAGILFFSTFAAWADTTETVASQNAFVLRSSAGTDEDESQTLTTKRLNDSNTRIAYVRFDLTSFFVTHSINGITSATLRLYQTSAIADTMKVYGLNSTIGGTNEFDDVWTNAMTFNNQPPGVIANSATGLPNNNTTAVLGSLGITAVSGEIDITLTLADFKSFLTTNGDAKITLIFYNTGSTTPSFASIANTGSFLQPTLELAAPALVSGTVTWSGANSGDWDTNTLNWTSSGSPTNFLQGNSARFDDTLLANSTVNLTTTLLPIDTTVSNIVTDYTFNGSGNLSGKLLKQGTGKLIIDNSGANGFSTLTISNGTLQVGNNDANGNLGTVAVTNYGNLVFNRNNNIVFNNNIFGTGNVIQNGSGALTLSGTTAHTGATIVNSGTLAVNTLSTLGLLTNAMGSTMAVSGSNAGPVFVNGTLAPGNTSAAGTFSAGNGVTLGSTAILLFDVGSTNTEGGGVNDSLIVNGNLAENGTLEAVPTLGAPLIGVPYTLAEFGSASGSFTTTSGGHYTATFNQTPTNLTVTFSGSGANLKWNSASSSAWDSGVTTNWLNGATLDYFYQGDSVTFDDTASQTTVTLAGTMSPTFLTNNSSANNYTIGGGKISGAANIVKSGSSTLALNNANDFTGTVTVNAGVLKIGNNSALGATNGGTVIASGATMDVNSRNLGEEPVTVLGNGTDGNGAIINNLGSATTFSNVNLSCVTLAGDTTFGGSARLDLRSPATGDPSQASLTMQGGGSFNLTKKGANQLAIVGVTVDTNLANIDIQNGIMSVEAATTGLGNPASNLTVESGAILGFFNMTNLLNKNFILNGNGLNGNFGTLNNFAGNNTIIGPMTLNGDVQICFRNNVGNPIGGNLTLSNAIGGTGSLTKNDTNTLMLAGSDSHSGGTTIKDGTFILNAISSDPNNVLTANPTGFYPGTSLIVGGNGTNIAPVDIEDTLWPGVGGKPSTFGVGNGPGNDYPGQDGTLMFGAVGSASPSVIFDLGSTASAVGGGVNDLVVVNGDLEGNFAHVKINPLGILDTSTPYTLITYTGAKNGNFSGTVGLLSGTSRYNFSLNYPANAVTLSVSGGPAALVWDNAANNGQWDANSSQNWSNTVSLANDVFYNQDTVLLDDSITNSATPTTSINLTTAVSPTLVTNNSTTNYIVGGIGKISGTASIIKTGGSTLTLLTTNDFTGNVLISGGMVTINNNNSLGAVNGTVFITNGATLNLASNLVVNGLNFGSKPFIISGWGVNSNGAIVNNNSSVAQQNAFQNVTLADNTAIGGGGRFDIRSPVATSAAATLSTGGHSFKLTKLGTNFVALSSVAIDPALADIDVQAGTLSIETQTASLGNPANKVTVFNSATLELWNLTNVISKPIVLQNGSTIINGSGNNTYGGGITLQGDATLNVGSLGLTLSSAISGTGNLTRSGTAPLTLTADNTISGGVLLTAGTTTLNGSGAFSASTNVFIASSATVDVSGRSDLTLTLNSGQTVSGSGNIIGKMTNNVGSTLSPGGKGVIGTLTVSSAAVLKGASYMEVTNNGANFDRLSCGSVAFGGTLVISNLDLTHPFTTNSSFQLFSAGTYSGAFASILPANPNNDPTLAWDTNSLTVNGTLKIAAVITGPPPTPHIIGISLNGTTLVINATNGASGGQYVLLSTTNVALPLSQWQTNVTGSFDGNGNLNLSTNIVSPSDGQKFYILKQ